MKSMVCDYCGMDIKVYTFEDENGDAETWSTQNYSEALDWAQENKKRLICNTYEWTDSEMFEDYTGTEED